MQAIAQANPNRPRYTNESGQCLDKLDNRLPKEAKPALMTKKREQAVVRLSGVKGDGVHRKNNQEPGRPASMKEAKPEDITVRRFWRGSEKPIVAKKQGNACGAKGLY